MAGRSKSINLLGFMVKLLILIAVIMAGLFVYLTCAGKSCLVQRIDQMPPDALKVPWEIRTPTKMYYAEEAEKTPNGDVVMINWYEPAGKKWLFHKGKEILPRELYGDITLRRR